MEILIKILQLILSLSILVIFHEFGHFIAAKIFKTRVEKFYLFFNPWFSLFKFKYKETEYGMGWLPLGGYVKISGMIDESMDKEQMKLPPQPWEFRSKPAWQRLIIMLGGVTVNVLLAIVIFIFILWAWGREYLPPQSARYGIVADSLAQSIGLRDGDVIMKLDTNKVKDITRVQAEIILNEPKTLSVKRGDEMINLSINDQIMRSLNSRSAKNFVLVRAPFIIDTFSKHSEARDKGLLIGDRIIGVNGKPTPYFHEFKKAVENKKNEEITLSVLRDNDTLQYSLKLDKDGLIGVRPRGLKDQGFIYEVKKYNFLQAIPAGFNLCWETLGNYMTGLKQLFTGKAKASESLGSLISIGGIFPAVWDWQSFWTLTAIFSIILAFMNVLPIPALDGGHALFTLVEMITGRKPGDKFMEYAQMVGMILLLGLMAYALGLDIWRIFR